MGSSLCLQENLPLSACPSSSPCPYPKRHPAQGHTPEQATARGERAGTFPEASLSLV